MPAMLGRNMPRERHAVSATMLAAVIVRLDRTIQYAGTPLIDPKGRGVLKAPLRGA